MIGKKIIQIVFLFAVLNTVGQNSNTDYIFTKSDISCEEMYTMLSGLIPELYDNNQIEILDSLLVLWDQKCIDPEASDHLKILLAIENSSFNEKLYDKFIFFKLEDYKRNIELLNTDSSLIISDRENYVDIKNLYYFIRNLADQINKKNDNLTVIEQFFVGFYSSDSTTTISSVESELFDETKLQEYYYKAYNNQAGSIFFITGAWIPDGSLNQLGNHAILGVGTGMNVNRLYVGIEFYILIGKSPNTYQTEKDGIIWDTDEFGGYSVGLNLANLLFTDDKNYLDFSAGIGYAQIDVLEEDNPNNEDEKIKKSLNSLNLNIGLGYMFIFESEKFLGIDIRYNFIDFNNTSGTDLSGNYISVMLKYGFNGRYSKWN